MTEYKLEQSVEALHEYTVYIFFQLQSIFAQG